jgi:RNA polymerase sigma factor for flagellar operon FliA
LTKEELFHYGIIGLLEAQKNFVADQGTPWAVFAAFRIEGAMLDHLRKAPLIRLPQKVQERVRRLKDVRSQLEQTEEPVSVQNLAEKLDWTVAEVAEIQALIPTVVGIADEELNYDDGVNFTNKVVLSDRSEDCDPQDNLLKKELALVVEHCLQTLPEMRDRLIVKARKLEDITLRELAASFKCSIESVRKREKIALIQLRECLQRNGWQGLP